VITIATVPIFISPLPPLLPPGLPSAFIPPPAASLEDSSKLHRSPPKIKKSQLMALPE